jgi:hypothetical protein
MSRPAEIITVTFLARHCTEYGCEKCAARSRWNRRKGLRSGKSLRKATNKNRERR